MKKIGLKLIMIWAILLTLVLIFNIKEIFAAQEQYLQTGVLLNNDLTFNTYAELHEALRGLSTEYWQGANDSSLIAMKTRVTKDENGTYYIGKGNNKIDATIIQELIGAWDENMKDKEEWDVWLEIDCEGIERVEGNDEVEAQEGKVQPFAYKGHYKINDQDEDFNPEEEAWYGTVAIENAIEDTADAVDEAASTIANTVKGIHKFATGGFQKILNDLAYLALDMLLNLFRFFADIVQILANLIQSAPDGTFGWITYDPSIEKLGERNDYVNLGKYTAKEEVDTNKEADNDNSKNTYKEIIVKEKGFTSKTQIPVIQVDLYTLALGKVELVDVNFFNPSSMHDENGAWMKIRNLITNLIKITMYVSAALLISSLIWNAIHLVSGSITPNERRKYIEGFQRFAESVVMLVCTVIIMAIGIYGANMFLPNIKRPAGNKSEDVLELPIRVQVEEAKYSFSTNPTGYVRYMTEMQSKDALQERLLYISVYFLLAECNLIAAILMFFRMLALFTLAIVGPIVAVLHGLDLTETSIISYRDWATWFLLIASIQIIFALITRLILDIAII